MAGYCGPSHPGAADLNLGITTYVNGTPMNPVQIDASTAATDAIAYVATDQNGLTSTSTQRRGQL
jgi:hypothetical protein